MKNKLSYYYSVLLVAAINLAFLGGIYFFYSEISELMGEIGVIRNENRLMEQKIRNISFFNEIAGRSGGSKEILDNAFVNESNLVRFIEDLEKTAQDAFVTVKISSASAASGQEMSGPTFQFTASGGFGQLYKYLELIENLPYQIAVERAEFVKSAGGWELKLQVKVLSYEF